MLISLEELRFDAHTGKCCPDDLEDELLHLLCRMIVLEGGGEVAPYIYGVKGEEYLVTVPVQFTVISVEPYCEDFEPFCENFDVRLHIAH